LVLEDNLDLVELDQRLEQHLFTNPPSPNRAGAVHSAGAGRQDRFTFHATLESMDSMAVALAQLGFRYFAQAHSTYSLWCTTGSDTMKPCLRIYDNLPALDAFSQLLIGEEEQTTIDDDVDEPPTAAEQESGTEPAPWSGGGIGEAERFQWF
jgi:hypothetical protein